MSWHEPVRLALFDMDDVVYDYSRPDRIAVLAAATGLAPEFIERKVWLEGLEADADGGAYPTADLYLASWHDRLGHPVSEDVWVKARAAGMTLIPGTLAVIDRLIEGGIAVAVLTNNGPLVERHRHVLAPELARRTGARFLASYGFGTQKPDPAIYAAALERLGFSPSESVFIDDRADNAEGAVTAGMRAHVFTDPATLADWFEGLGALPRSSGRRAG